MASLQLKRSLLIRDSLVLYRPLMILKRFDLKLLHQTQMSLGKNLKSKMSVDRIQ